MNNKPWNVKIESKYKTYTWMGKDGKAFISKGWHNYITALCPECRKRSIVSEDACESGYAIFCKCGCYDVPAEIVKNEIEGNLK